MTRRGAALKSSSRFSTPGVSKRPFTDPGLVASLGTGDCVAFVGAGFSKPMGMPLWAPLLSRLVAAIRPHLRAADEVPKALLAYAEGCIKHNELARAASALRRADPNHIVDDQLREAFDYDRLFRQRDKKDPARREMENRGRSLLALPWAGVVTTNYDDFLDHAGSWNIRVETPWQRQRLGQTLKMGGRPFLVHLHGHVGTGKYVLAEEDYDSTYLGAATVQSFLRALLLRYTVVFIGTLVEDRFVEFKRELQLVFQDHDAAVGASPPLSNEYVLLPETAVERGGYLESTHGFRCVYYKNDTGNHEGLVPLLDSIRDRLLKSEGKSQLDVICDELLSIVKSAGADGLAYRDIALEFMKRFGRNKKFHDFGTLNLRELYYRLFSLVQWRRLSFDERSEKFSVLRRRTLTH